jgi:hypothetical protein
MSGFQRLEWACANAYILAHAGNRIRLWLISRRNRRRITNRLRGMSPDQIRTVVQAGSMLSGSEERDE